MALETDSKDSSARTEAAKESPVISRVTNNLFILPFRLVIHQMNVYQQYCAYIKIVTICR